ncbi:hypothetical protein [Pseudomonas oryzihabitans]|uniref:hypothetical protein n=1 Tax=Pseudomonas oryzihabitans TaxID=47885 RepID=UPI002894F92A|nr:hypothetical protein [Pseudomonas oryzihabitans]MDT3723223.1 hypothetical protein [Pseudomonas oryzihabitans]
METLSSIFQRTFGAPIEMDGRTIIPLFQMSLSSGRKDLLVRRLNFSLEPVVGLRIKAVKGKIEVNGCSHSEIILWADTSPDVVLLSVFSKSGCDVKIWNVWRSGDLVQAWVGNAGLVVAENKNSVRLECSGGNENIDFCALVVQIDFLE